MSITGWEISRHPLERVTRPVPPSYEDRIFCETCFVEKGPDDEGWFSCEGLWACPKCAPDTCGDCKPMPGCPKWKGGAA